MKKRVDFCEFKCPAAECTKTQASAHPVMEIDVHLLSISVKLGTQNGSWLGELAGEGPAEPPGEPEGFSQGELAGEGPAEPSGCLKASPKESWPVKAQRSPSLKASPRHTWT